MPRGAAQQNARRDSVQGGSLLASTGGSFLASAEDQFIAEQNGIAPAAMFPMNDAKTPPGLLATNLVNNGFFQEAGFVAPNERN